MYTFFVLDFDGTYDHPVDDVDLGVEPTVYLIPVNKQNEIEGIADQAAEEFHTSDDNTMCIGDIFERRLTAKGIFFQYIGFLKIPYCQRQVDYLPDYIPKVIV